MWQLAKRTRNFVTPQKNTNTHTLYIFQELGVDTTLDNREVVKNNEVVYLSVKPYIIPDIMAEISDVVQPHNLFVSIAAGITIESIENVSNTIKM